MAKSTVPSLSNPILQCSSIPLIKIEAHFIPFPVVDLHKISMLTDSEVLAPKWFSRAQAYSPACPRTAGSSTRLTSPSSSFKMTSPSSSPRGSLLWVLKSWCISCSYQWPFYCGFFLCYCQFMRSFKEKLTRILLKHLQGWQKRNISTVSQSPQQVLACRCPNKQLEGLEYRFKARVGIQEMCLQWRWQKIFYAYRSQR